MNAVHQIVGDPDVDQAIEDLAPIVGRLRRVNGRLAEIDPVMQYREHMGARAEAQQCRDLVKGRAAKLCVPAGALLLIVEEAARLREQVGRKPARHLIERALDTATTIAERTAAETAAALAVAKVEDAAAERHRAACVAARKVFAGRPL